MYAHRVVMSRIDQVTYDHIQIAVFYPQFIKPTLQFCLIQTVRYFCSGIFVAS